MGWLSPDKILDKVAQVDVNPVITWLLKILDVLLGTVERIIITMLAITVTVLLVSRANFERETTDDIKNNYYSSVQYNALYSKLRVCEVKDSVRALLDYQKAVKFDSLVIEVTDLRAQLRYLYSNQSAIQNKIDKSTKLLKNETSK